MTKLYLYGRNPLKEALAQGKDGLISRVFLTSASEADGSLVSLLQKHGLKHERVTEDEIESMSGRGATHQGVCAELDERKLYTSLEEALQKGQNGPTNPLFVLLDELHDPHNVGAIIRSAAAFGATAILLPEHDQVQVTSTVIKTSAGAVFSLPIVRITNVNTTLRTLKDKGYWTYALTGSGDTRLASTTFDTPIVLVIGNEGEGIKPKTLEVCDFKLAIDINANVESLNASNAVAVTLYEWNKQQAH
jgi:23S rRNA (guanosine2251-2'-O)-methyltransferase